MSVMGGGQKSFNLFEQFEEACFVQIRIPILFVVRTQTSLEHIKFCAVLMKSILFRNN